MKRVVLTILLTLGISFAFSQTLQRVKISSVTASANTGQDYSPWLNDNLNDLVQNVWSENNSQYVDVTVKLEKPSFISKLSLYDYEGVFTTNPAEIYALNGTQKTFLGLFTGPNYMTFDDLNLSNPILADAIIVHKYRNNIPQKINVYESVSSLVATPPHQRQQIKSVINFATLSDKTIGDAAFNLVATSNNTGTPITFASSNPSVVSISQSSGVWMATILSVGSSSITASQNGKGNYAAAVNVVQMQNVKPKMIQSVISFGALPAKTVGDAPVQLIATSNNTSTPVTFASSNPSVISVSYSSGVWMSTAVAAGTANITVSQSGNSNYLQAANVTQAQTVQPKMIQSTIGFGTLPAITVGNTPVQLIATSNNTSTPVTFTSSNSSVITVSNSSGGWMATAVAAGSATITASQAGTTTYLAAGDVSQTQLVNAAPSTSTVTGSYIPVPSKIEAENFSAMSGVQTESTADAGGGLDVGWLSDGDWMDYNLSVATAGTYTFSFRIANKYADGKLEIRTADGTVLGSLAIPVTGDWQAWSTISATASLASGNQSLRIYVVRGDWNVNWFQVTQGSAVAVTPTQNVPAPAPVTPSNPAPTSTIPGTTKIPMNGKNWYQLNNVGDAVGATQGLQEMNDGVLNIDPFNGWGKLLNNYNCWYDFKNLKNVIISRIRIFAGDKASPGQPFNLYARKSFNDSTFLATYDGSQAYMSWIDIVLPTPVSANYLMANVYWNFPNEIELYGTYTSDSATVLSAKKDIRFRDQLGINEAIWDLTQGAKDVNIKDTLDPTRLKLAKAFTQVRDYVEWDKIETVQGTFVFQNTLSGGWNYDKMYKGLKANNMEVLPCLKNIPNWFLNAYYPSGLQDAENVPAPYGSDLLNPNSYILQAKFGFQFVARYGSAPVDPSLLSGVMTGLINPNDPTSLIRTKESGMGLIRYIECENERDKWWKGRKAYQNGFEYAANLSAFYDGNKNTMGPGVGVKNADPGIKVVIGGIASTSTDYVRAIIDWCKENRGYKADGSVDLCFDVINYHSYANNAGTSQGGQSTRGSAPEVGGSAIFAQNFAQLSREYNIESWVTETGYDLNQYSNLHAPAIGNKTPEEVEADWIVRTALLGARSYLNKTFFYQMYDYAPSSGQIFASSGLLNDQQFNNGVWSRKRAADYTMQTQNLIGNYSYKETISNDPTVDRYQLNDTSVYALAIPDEVGRTAAYTLKTGTADSAGIYTLVAGGDTMQMQKVKIINGQLQITVTETPVFVKLIGQNISQTARRIITDTAANSRTINENLAKIKKMDMTTAVKLFPNPTTNVLNVELKNETLQNVELRIVEAASGKVFKSFNLNEKSLYISRQFDVKSLPAGMFVLQILKGGEIISKKFIKM